MGPAAGPPRRRTGACRGPSLGGVWLWGLGTLALAWCHKPFRGCEMRRCVLCGRWARLAFLGAREKKALVVVVAKTKIELQPPALPPIDGCSARG